MTAPRRALADDDARRTAIAVHDRSFLVEAGAGSGKTAIMAGRIADMLAEGVAPGSIAAVTFTELAASELLLRVHELVETLAAGRVPAELQAALPDGLCERQRGHLAAATESIDEMTCSTIHGFCQRLIKPYPVEADIDPGATVMDRDEADLVFREIVDAWLREALAGDAGGLLEELVLQDPGRTIGLIHEILARLRSHREVARDPRQRDPAPLLEAFEHASDDFTSFVNDADVTEDDTGVIAGRFAELAGMVHLDPANESPGDLVALLLAQPGPELCTTSGDFRRYRKKTKWVDAARRAGLAKADGDRLNAAAEMRYARCRETWTVLRQAVAARVLNDLVRLLVPVMERFRSYKRSAALLDFDDLIFAARDLLRDHEDVRRALAERFAHVLVDEFQDTDPIQAEIFWRLCGEPQGAAADADWRAFRIRPGALFLVGDPKQAIYRFRGADVATYVRAREAFREQGPECILEISTNFRSCPSILQYVNERFEGPLAVGNDQPGFTALTPFQPDRVEGPSVAALDVAVANEEGKATAEEQRDGEAEAVAEMCARLIGSEMIRDADGGGERRACRPGDIALLAPTGSELWRYEEALERHGIPVATQAGKGLFRRQEIQDLIAVTRVLADGRDTLALGALLRGPLVGLTEEQLLDIVAALPPREDAPDAQPRLDIGVEPEAVAHPLARDIVEKLQSLRRGANATTPHDLLSQAVDVLRVRPILLQRHGGQAERALANVDLYLSFSRAYAVRGLRAFAEAMTAAWTDESRAVEGRPDAQEQSVALYTMHAAKGLEWPIVVPVNTMSRLRAPEKTVIDRETGRLYFPVFGVAPTGHEAAFENEKAELDRERIRLWYVAATRARELLIVPRLDVPPAPSAWISLVDFSLAEVPGLDLGHHPLEFSAGGAGIENTQTRERFVQEAATVTDRQRRITWLAPSRDEGTDAPALDVQPLRIFATDTDDEAEEAGDTYTIRGGRERGVILHKLIEEVLTGETPETLSALVARAESLIRVLGHPVADDPAQGLAPAELAGCVIRALSLPEIADLRPRLVPEVPVYSADSAGAEERVTAGVADAVAFGSDGTPEVVIDWKSDVDPTPGTLQHYCSQVRAYLEATKAERGLVVVMTSGTVLQAVQMPSPITEP